MSAEILVTVGADGTLELTTSAALQTIEVASPGPEGPGAPRGGATDQVVAKASDADLDFKFVTLTPQFVGAEPAVTSGTTSDYWRGDKTWRNFFADVRAATLTGLSTAVNAAVTAADTVLSAIGKLQAQVTGLASSKLDVAATSFGGNAATSTKLQTARTISLSGVVSGSASFDGSANATINTTIAAPVSGNWFNGIPRVGTDGVMEIGKFVDFHETSATTADYDGRLSVEGGGELYYRKNGGTPNLVYHSGNINTANAATATKLQTARTLTIGNTGKSVDGSANVSWSLAEIGAPATDGTGATGTWGVSITGNAATATTLQTARTINGTSFNGSANITTANWGTARTLTIGNTGKSVNGSANVSWSLAEIGVVSASDTTQGIVELATAAEARAGTDATRAVTPQGIAAYAGALSFRNRIINGKMEVSQRGTSWNLAHATTTYTLDRFLVYEDTDGSVSVAQSTDAPTEFQNSLRVTVSTVDAALGATQRCQIDQKIEGYNVRDLVGRDFTLSFWVRSAKTGTHCVSFSNSVNDRSYVAEYTVNAANTWEYKTITVPGGIPSAGTWNFQNGAGMLVRWALCAGSSYRTTAGSWAAGDFIASPNQVNVLDTADNIFAITGVQLELGSYATQFEHRPYGLELTLCQRYYEPLSVYQRGYAGAGTETLGMAYNFRVTKRAVPTVTLNLAYANASNGTVYDTTVNGFVIRASATNTGDTIYNGSAVASAEL